MKIAIMASMLPMELQDFVYQNVEQNTGFGTMRERIGAWVSNRAAADEGSVAARVAEVDGREREPYDVDEECVDVVGAWTKCYKCEGWGHTARECPSKGKGKSDQRLKGKGKGMMTGD